MNIIWYPKIFSVFFCQHVHLPCVDLLFPSSSAVECLFEKRNLTFASSVECSQTTLGTLMRKNSMYSLLSGKYCYFLLSFINKIEYSSTPNLANTVQNSIEAILKEYGFQSPEISFFFTLPPQPCCDPITGYVYFFFSCENTDMCEGLFVLGQ